MESLQGKTIVVSGAGGTVGRPLTEALGHTGAHVIGWDRERVSPLDPEASRRWLHHLRPHVVYQLAIASRGTGASDEGRRINYEWPRWLAECCRELGAKLVFTSTAMVFSNDAVGPFTIESPPDASEGYGHEKRLAENAVREAHPGATVVRLGWQIGSAPGSNNMIDHFERQLQEQGVVRASRRWLPACSFVDDTVAALMALATRNAGLYMIDANDRWSFYDIARALGRRHHDKWGVEPTDDFVYDQRLLDPRLGVPHLATRLEELESL